MAAQQPVAPNYGSGATVSTGASATVSVPRTKQLVLTNLGANVCYVRCGAVTPQTATAADYPVPAGAQVTISKGDDDIYMAHFGSVATTLHYMGGEGY